MNTRPKTFVAVTNFRCNGHSFSVGDVVPSSIALQAALRYGDRFVTVRRRRAARPAPVTVPPQDPTTDPAGDGDTPQED